MILQVHYVPLSANEKQMEEDLNKTIAQIEEAHVNDFMFWDLNYISVPDSNKVMLVYGYETPPAEGDEGEDEFEPGVDMHIGFRVIQGSQDIEATERLLNKTFGELTARGTIPFFAGSDISGLIPLLYHPSEFTWIIPYIILNDGESGNDWPCVKLIPNPVDARQGSVQTTDIFRKLIEGSEETHFPGLMPRQVLPLDNNTMLIVMAH